MALERPRTRCALALVLAVFGGAPGHADVDCVAWEALDRREAAPPSLAELVVEIGALSERFAFIGTGLETLRPDLCASDEMSTAHGFYSVEENRIAIDTTLPPALQMAILVHELRHLWQFGSGVCPSSDLAMDQYGLGIMALEADASAASLFVAWDMKERGRADVWEALSAWPTQSDIAAAYARTITQTRDPMLAMSAAFRQWYASERRVHSYFQSACSGYLDRQDAEHLLPSYDMLAEDFYADLCIMPDGRPYLCVPPPGIDP